MPNQFFPRGYYGYPYPQQNIIPQGPEAFAQYQNTGMAQPQMPQPYMGPAPFADPMGSVQPPQYEYPYLQYGYPNAPYGYNQPPAQAAQQSYPPVQANQAPYLPTMQPPAYGQPYAAQSYPQQAPQVAPEMQYWGYADPSRQYWPGYQMQQPIAGQAYDPYAAAYQGVYAPAYDPAQSQFDPRQVPDEPPAPEEDRKRPSRQHRERRSQRESARGSKSRRERRESAEQLRAEKKAQEDAKKAAARKETLLAQQKIRAAKEEAAKQEAARKQALRQKAQIMQKIKEQGEDPNNQFGFANDGNANNQMSDPTAAAAASIAAFHEAAKSVNEINLNEVTQALKSKRKPTFDIDDLEIDLPGASSSEEADLKRASSENLSEEVSTAITGNDSDELLASTIKIKDASDIEIPGIIGAQDEKVEAQEKIAAKSDEILAAPSAEDMVEVAETVSEEEKEAATSDKDATIALDNAVVENVASDKKADSDIAKTLEFAAIGAESSSEEKSEPAKDDSKSDSAIAATSSKDDDKKEEGVTAAKAETSDESSQETAAQAAKQGVFPLSIVGLVFGIVGVILAACAPIINFLGYAALAVGVIALIISIISVILIAKKKRSGKPIAIGGIACGAIAIIAAIALHFLMPVNATSSSSSTTPNSSVLAYVANSSSSSATSTSDGVSADANDAQETPSADASQDQAQSNDAGQSTSQGAASSSSAMTAMSVTPEGNYQNLSVGQSVSYSNGLNITVDSIETGLTGTSGNQMVCVTVTYKNNGSSSADYNSFDWKVEDSNGSLKTYAIYSSGENELNSGELAPGSTVTGNLYFDGPIKEVIYEADYWNSASNATWKA